MSPCGISKEKAQFYKSTPLHVLSCSPGATTGAAHSARLWRWSTEAERTLECGGPAWKHTWLPLTETGWNDGTLIFCFFLPPFQPFVQSLTLRLSAPSRWRTLNALAVKYICVYLEVRGLQRQCSSWQREEKEKGTYNVAAWKHLMRRMSEPLSTD